jgi:hypothetical protein
MVCLDLLPVVVRSCLHNFSLSAGRWRRGHKRVHEGEGSETLLAVHAMAEICERALPWDAWFRLHEAIQALHDRLLATWSKDWSTLQPYQSVNASIVGRN